MAYAEGTSVSVEKSVAEIITAIRKHDGNQIAQLDDDLRYVIGFSMYKRQVRFVVQFKPLADKAFERDGRGSVRDAVGRRNQWEQHRRQRMRALLLVIKAKLESVESSVETFEQAFLANVVTADGKTVHEQLQAQIAGQYDGGAVAPLVIGGPA